MCGINGIYNLRDGSAKERISTMDLCMAHRGPDNDGTFVNDDVALGHRRLSIIDLSDAGHQPMFSNDKRYSITYNGEIYNFRQLKFELQRVESGSKDQAYFFRTNSDTEVILAAYARWGPQCLQRFNGMFAFAIWDDQEKQLFVARDRMGIKPLYYAEKDGVLIFSSEIRSLLASGLVPPRLNTDVLHDYIGFQTVYAPATMVKGVKMLLPGHYILAGQGKTAIKKYWSLEGGEAEEAQPYKETCGKINELFMASVERRLIADVPFGAFLSGGIDSSAVVSAMSKVSSVKVKTFCVTFEEKEFSEAAYARMVSERFGTEHHELLLKASEFVEELPHTLDAMDHPSGDGPNSYIVSKATRKAGITMALSGLGGDELFAGYPVFGRMTDLQKKKWLGAVPAPVRELAGAVASILRPGIRSEKMNEFLHLEKVDFSSTYSLTRQVLVDKYVKALLGKKDLPVSGVKKIVDKLQGFSDKQHLLSRVSVAEISTYMQNVLLRDTDQMSMAHALEVRVPFLDHKLVEYVLNVPDRYKFPVTPKKLLVDSLCADIPREVIDRPKMGFTLPWAAWMQNELKAFCEERLEVLKGYSCFNAKEVDALWDRFLANDPRINWSRLWHLVVLGHWLKKNGIHE